MCWSFLHIGIRQAKIRKKAEMQVLFLLKTSLAIQNTISFAPRTLRLLPIHIWVDFAPKREKSSKKCTFSSLLSVFYYLDFAKCLNNSTYLTIPPLSISLLSIPSFFRYSFPFPYPPTSSFLWPTNSQAMSKKSSRACTHTQLPTGFLIFCCHKCHNKSIFTIIFHPFPSLFCLLIQVFPSFKIIPPNDILNNSSF